MRDPKLQALFLELFKDLPQHGPGSDASTRRALHHILKTMTPARILDIGCGAGRSSLLLAKETTAQVTALDLNRPYLDALRVRADAAGLGERLMVLKADMAAPPVPTEGFDLIWAEGSIYVIGVETGLAAWRPMLAPGGRLAFTELSWLTEDPSPSARAFWANAYPAMGTVAENRARLDRAGFRVETTFALPREDWTQDFYDPLRASIAAFRRRHADDPVALAIAANSAREIEVFEQNPGAYSYVFYIAQTRET